jgi:hypothetical protein
VSSFDVTFLGHQGWLFSSGGSRLLADPLLTPAFGHAGAVGQVYPPRSFAFEAMPPIDALLLTHEHEDHFDVPSLACIDRRVPVLLSAHSSTAAHRFLVELGFGVRRVRPGDVVSVGALEVFFFAPDLSGAVGDEWDVLPFLVRDREGHGSFFTSVDVPPHGRLERALRRIIAKPGLWCYTNNSVDLSSTRGGRVLAADDGVLAFARETLAHYAGLCARWARPEAVLFCGNGLAFAGERAWLNRNVFRCHSDQVCTALSALAPADRLLAPVPGQTVSMRQGAVVDTHAESSFLRALPAAEWTSRAFRGDVDLVESYPSFLSPCAFDREALRGELAAFAAYLYSSKLFRALYSLDPEELGGRRATFAVVALSDGDPYVYEYDPTSCTFVVADSDDPVAEYVGGIECWGGDLLAVLRGEAPPSAIVFGRGRSWNALPERCDIGWTELWSFCHPLRWPERFLALYRRLFAAHADAAVCVRAASRDSRSTSDDCDPSTRIDLASDGNVSEQVPG